MSQTSNAAAASLRQYKKRSQIGSICRRFAKSKTAMAGLVILVILALVALCCPLFLDYSADVTGQNMRERLQFPSWEHPFGTDQYGRDVLARVVWGTRISLSAALVIISIATVVGALLGAVAAYYGGKVDNVIMRCMDVLLAIPSILLATAIVAALGPSLPNVVIAIGLANIPQFARIVRASVLTIKGQEYIEAARAMGASDLRIIAKYIIPHSMAPLIVQGSVGVASAILSIASLSFVGLGVQPPTPEWGAMLSNARTYMRDAWHITVMPGAAIMLSILSLNIIGDGLRDALDPRLKN